MRVDVAPDKFKGSLTAVRTAGLVITGEGSLDPQSLAGKAPWGVAQAAARAAGFGEVHALTHFEPDLERCQRDASTLLASLARRLAETSHIFRAAEAEGYGNPAATADSARSRLTV